MTFNQLTNHFGGVAAMTRRFGLHRQTIFYWKKAGIPDHWQLEFALLSVSAHKPLRARKRALDKIRRYAPLLTSAASPGFSSLSPPERLRRPRVRT